MTTKQCTHCGNDREPGEVFYALNERVCRCCYYRLMSRVPPEPVPLHFPWAGASCGVALLAMLYSSGWIWPVLEWWAEIVDGLALLLVAVLIVGTACWVEMWSRSGKQI